MLITVGKALAYAQRREAWNRITTIKITKTKDVYNYEISF
jgi:hypothetical protein